jgi:ACS family pantothenate transporter-like MFS transporter
MATLDGRDSKEPVHKGSVDYEDGNTSDKIGTQTSTSIDRSQETHIDRRGGWFHWHEPGTSKQEKRLIFKLDWFLLSYGCLCFFNKYLDQTNISNAYVSGMSEELNFGPGNELSWMNTYFNIGYIIGGPISNIILTIVAPRIWLPSCMGAWSIFVLFLYKCNTAPQFYALRFCIGFFESAAFPGIHYVLGSWVRTVRKFILPISFDLQSILILLLAP